MNISRPLTLVLILILSLSLLSGCGAIKTAARYNKLESNLNIPMQSLFLVEMKSNKVAVSIADSTKFEIKDDVQNSIETTLKDRGYEIVPRSQADYIVHLKLNCKQVEKAASELDHPESSAKSAAAGGIAGGAIGAMSGEGVYGLLIGAGIGTMAAVGASDIGDNMVKLVRLDFIGQLMILERTDQSLTLKSRTNLSQGTGTTQSMDYTDETNFKRYTQWFNISVQQANMDWDDARPEIIRLAAKGATDSFETY